MKPNIHKMSQSNQGSKTLTKGQRSKQWLHSYLFVFLANNAQGQGRYHRLPCLREPRGYCVSRNPPSMIRAPQNCEELRGYIQNVRSLERVREGEWSTLQLLLDLVEFGVWRWRPKLHSPLLSELFRLSGTIVTPEGLSVYPHVIENVYLHRTSRPCRPLALSELHTPP
jgi:hypothetical protein